MGSLNGTLLNSRSVRHPDIGSRKWGNPVGLASEDIITLGTTTKVYVSRSEWLKVLLINIFLLFLIDFSCNFVSFLEGPYLISE